MPATKLNAKELFASLDETSSDLLELISSTDETTINRIPFKNSWTAAQVTSHITKSNKAIEQALHMEGKSSWRNPAERVQELKSMFLNFTVKFNSPEFILPTHDSYQKETLISDLKKSIGQLKETGSNVNLSEIISLPAFGEITKLELLHFVWYHTQRHIHQVNKILKIIKQKNK